MFCAKMSNNNNNNNNNVPMNLHKRSRTYPLALRRVLCVAVRYRPVEIIPKQIPVNSFRCASVCKKEIWDLAGEQSVTLDYMKRSMKLKCGTMKRWNNVLTVKDKVTSGGKDRRM